MQPLPSMFVSDHVIALPHVLQKNMGLFSFLSQLAHVGNSSQVVSTRNRSRVSEGGSEWPSRRGVNFLQENVKIIISESVSPFSRGRQKVKELVRLKWNFSSSRREKNGEMDVHFSYPSLLSASFFRTHTLGSFLPSLSSLQKNWMEDDGPGTNFHRKQ